MKRVVLVPVYIFWPLAYLAALAGGMAVLWWTILIGGNPLEVKNVSSINSVGSISTSFRPGDIVGIHRQVCTMVDVGVQYYPALKNDRGYVFPLPTGVSHLRRGCRDSLYGFTLPSLPPGPYSYVNTVRFQNNLVGRDEYTTLPPIAIQVLP